MTAFSVLCVCVTLASVSLECVCEPCQNSVANQNHNTCLRIITLLLTRRECEKSQRQGVRNVELTIRPMHLYCMCVNVSVKFPFCLFLCVFLSVVLCVHLCKQPHCQMTAAKAEMTGLLIPVSVPGVKNNNSALKLSTQEQIYAHTNTHLINSKHIVGCREKL